MTKFEVIGLKSCVIARLPEAVAVRHHLRTVFLLPSSLPTFLLFSSFSSEVGPPPRLRTIGSDGTCAFVGG